MQLEVTEDTVILEGDRIADKQEKKGGMEISERIYGHFYRAIPLPEGAKVDQAKANFDNGVLEVTIPVEDPKEKRRQIPISSATPATSGTAEKAA
jgi:HSP20 family protein